MMKNSSICSQLPSMFVDFKSGQKSALNKQLCNDTKSAL